MPAQSEPQPSLSLASYRKGIIIFILLLAIIAYAGARLYQESQALKNEYQALNESPALQSNQ